MDGPVVSSPRAAMWGCSREVLSWPGAQTMPLLQTEGLSRSIKVLGPLGMDPDAKHCPQESSGPPVSPGVHRTIPYLAAPPGPGVLPAFAYTVPLARAPPFSAPLKGDPRGAVPASGQGSSPPLCPVSVCSVRAGCWTVSCASTADHKTHSSCTREVEIEKLVCSQVLEEVHVCLERPRQGRVWTEAGCGTPAPTRVSGWSALGFLSWDHIGQFKPKEQGLGKTHGAGWGLISGVCEKGFWRQAHCCARTQGGRAAWPGR